jgi:alpha-tubulin suppressor-like RCC1 family protein/uncharacterized protein YkwD
MPCPNEDLPASRLTQEDAEVAVLCLINEQRAANVPPSPPLTLNIKLRDAARRHANAAKSIKWWDGGGEKIHTNPVDLSTPEIRIREAGYCPAGAERIPPKENGYTAWYRGDMTFQGGTTPQAAVTWWMGSDDHKKTLLDPNYGESGVAVVRGVAEKGTGPDTADGGVIVVQTFGACLEPVPVSLGKVWGWGTNDKGQVGDNTTTDRHTPVQPRDMGLVIAVAGGGYHSLAIMSDERVSTWGYNERGQLADGTTADKLAPATLPESTLNHVTAIAGGGYHSLALLERGSVLAWGLNTNGQLGDGSNDQRVTPKQVQVPGTVKAIAAGFAHSLALTAEKTVFAWGSNVAGELGDGTTTNRSTPVQVVGLSDIIAISAGFNHSLALKLDGSVWAWGDNSAGQLGDSSHVPRLTPVQVQTSPSVSGKIVKIAAGGVHNLALEQNGRVWAWGGNAYGQLGNGDTDDRWLPVRPVNMYQVAAIAAGFGHSMVRKEDGSVWTWGVNEHGQLGDNTTTNRSTPVQVMGLPGITGIAAGLHHSLAK